MKIPRPHPQEYPAYSSIYMDLLDDNTDILSDLWEQFVELRTLVSELPEAKLLYRYAPDKWSIKEILVHLIDDERIFAYRALRYARGDSTPLHGFDQDQYALTSGADERSLTSIFEEYKYVRKSTIALFRYLPEETHLLKGCGIDLDGRIINERTVRALAYHIAGHEKRHINIIKERYLS